MGDNGRRNIKRPAFPRLPVFLNVTAFNLAVEHAVRSDHGNPGRQFQIHFYRLRLQFSLRKKVFKTESDDAGDIGNQSKRPVKQLARSQFDDNWLFRHHPCQTGISDLKFAAAIAAERDFDFACSRRNREIIAVSLPLRIGIQFPAKIPPGLLSLRGIP